MKHSLWSIHFPVVGWIKVANMTPKVLKGDHNQCPSCLEYFNSTGALDKHRVGSFEPPERRCLTIPEMLEKGMVVNKAGFWVKEPMKEGRF